MTIYEQIELGIRIKYEIPDEAEVQIEEIFKSDPCELCGSHDENSVEIYWFIRGDKNTRKYKVITYNGTLLGLIQEIDNEH